MVLRLTLVPDSAARRRMLAGWLKEGSPVALQATLLALTQPNLREDARAAATAHPPDAVQLLSHFNDAHVEYRFAAAALLGANCAPDRCRMLEQMVRQNNHRREALAALLCCSDTEAGKFIAGLRSNRSLDAQLRYAHDRVARLCS